jgi:DNA-binding transcriptional regulator LsrR (DeoR family)
MPAKKCDYDVIRRVAYRYYELGQREKEIARKEGKLIGWVSRRLKAARDLDSVRHVLDPPPRHVAVQAELEAKSSGRLMNAVVAGLPHRSRSDAGLSEALETRAARYSERFSLLSSGALRRLKSQQGKHVIVVAGGRAKVPAICAAILGGYVRTLVTDERVAQELLV